MSIRDKTSEIFKTILVRQRYGLAMISRLPKNIGQT